MKKHFLLNVSHGGPDSTLRQSRGIKQVQSVPAATLFIYNNQILYFNHSGYYLSIQFILTRDAND